MEWPEPGVYRGVCRYCGAEKCEDATLGLGRDDVRTRVCGRYAAREEMAETKQEETMEIQIPEFPQGVAGNTAKGRFYAKHFDQIQYDLDRLGKDETIRKWRMSEAWLYDHFKGLNPNLARRKCRPKLPHVTEPTGNDALARAVERAQELPANSIAIQSAEPHGNGHTPLPAWRDDWKPEVQVEWLMTLRDIEVARIEAAK